MENFKWKVVLFFMLMFNTVVAFAQSEGTENAGDAAVTVSSKSTTTTTTQQWYTEPWVWIAGAAVFILLLVALLRGGSSVDKTERTHRTTVRKDVSTE